VPRRGARSRLPETSGFPPVRKSLGQHFLHDKKVLTRIADAVEATKADTVVEIGPGRGALTDLLAERAGRLIAIEYDRALAAILRERYASKPHVEILEADALTVRFAGAAGNDFLLVGNVPYYITTPLIFHALEAPRPRRALFLVQKEVADRIAGSPGSSAYGALSVNVQAVAHAELVLRVAAGAFQPPPKVDSALIRLTPLAQPVVRPAEEAPFREFVQSAFGMRRKQMRRVLRSLLQIDAPRAEAILAKAGVSPDVRPETLAPDDFASLVRQIADCGLRK
jgi:16S rRNA (adenine1518-N6/adenine1519-N6)-dimethyltransferase